MKTYHAAGICLAFALLICHSSAEEPQFQPRSHAASSARVMDPQPITLGDPIPVTLGDPELLTPTNPADNAGQPQFRAVTYTYRGQSPDEVKPLPPGTQVPLTSPPQIMTNPSGDQVIPVNPTLIQGGIVSSPGSCNCGGGLSGGTIVDDGCGSCCIGGCGDGCCGLGGCGLFSGWGSWNLLGWLHHGPADGCCSDGCCATDSCCCPSGCFDGCCYNGNRTTMWLTGEYLLYRFSSPNLPPLVTGGMAGTPLAGLNGNKTGLTTGPALGQPGTQVLIGPDSYDNLLHSGMRFDFGFWIPGCDKLGLDFGFMYLPQTNSVLTQGSGIIGRPFLDVTPGNLAGNFPNTEAVNGFNGTTGTVSVNYYSRVYGFDGNLRYKLCCGPNFKVDLLAGYRNFNLNEGVNINENLNYSGGNNQVSDNYAVNNSFNGGQFGIDAEYHFLRRWSVEGLFKLAVGDVRETASISGSQTTPIIGVPNFPAGVGFFANNANIGSYSRNQFAVLPEVNVKLGFDVTNNVRLFLTYNFLYLSNAVRAGDAIGTSINQNYGLAGSGAGAARPTFAFANSSFLAQGLGAGLDIHW